LSHFVGENLFLCYHGSSPLPRNISEKGMFFDTT